MKLKCEKHDRRVLTVSSSPNFLHRTGDMSVCDSKYAVLRDNVSKTTRKFAVFAHKHIPNLYALGPISTDKEAMRPSDQNKMDQLTNARP